MRLKKRWDAMEPKECLEFAIENKLPSMTKQEFKNDNSPQHIIDTYTRTGQVPTSMKPFEQSTFGDISKLPTYHQALTIIAKGQEAFMTMNAETRKFFDNDPGKFLAFIDDPKNIEEGEKLGLWKIRKPEPDKIQKVEVVQTPPPEDKGTKK